MRKKVPIKLSDAKKFNEEKAAAFVADLDKLEKRGCLKDPRRIGKLDESGFKLGYDDSIVIAKRIPDFCFGMLLCFRNHVGSICFV